MASSAALQASPAPSRRSQIVDEAASLFGSQGYHGTSMRDLAAACGVLAGSLYAHIGSKEEVLHDIVVGVGERFLEEIERVLAMDLVPEERLREAMRAHVVVVTEHLQHARVYLHEWAALTGERRDGVLRLRRRYERRWDEIVQALPDVRDRRFARLLALSAANWTYTWFDPDGSLTPTQIADRFTELLLQGLGPDGSGKIRERSEREVSR